MNKITKLIKLAGVIIVVLILVLLLFLNGIPTVEDILYYTPNNMILAGVTMIAIYSSKAVENPFSAEFIVPFVIGICGGTIIFLAIRLFKKCRRKRY